MVVLEEGEKKIPYFVEKEIIGSSLIGIKYEQLLPFAQPAENSENAFSGCI